MSAPLAKPKLGPIAKPPAMMRKKIGEKPSRPMTITSRMTASTATSAARIASRRVESRCVCTATASATSAETAISALNSSTACGNRAPSSNGAMKSITPAAVMLSSTTSST